MSDISVRVEIDDTLDNDTIEIVVQASEKNSDVDALIRKLSALTQRRLKATDQRGSECYIDESEIISVCSADRSVRIITQDYVYTSNFTLRSIEEQLSKRHFIKISRYELVNSDKIVKFDFTIGGTLRLELDGGIETWASRRYIPLIRKHLSGEGENE